MSPDHSVEPKPPAQTPPDGGLFREFLRFLGEHKVWWVTPFVLTLLLYLLFAVLGAMGGSPFIYQH